MNLKIITILSLNILFCHSTLANSSLENIPLCSSKYNVLTDDLPVLGGGRVKPYYVLARETMKFLTGSKKNAMEHFCKLSLKRDIEASEIPTNILVEHIDSKKLLGVKEDSNTISATELVAKKDILRAELMGLKENNSYKKDLNKVFARMRTYEQIINGEALRIYATVSDINDWRPISFILEQDDSEVIKILKASKDLYIKDKGEGFLLELTYFKTHIFSVAMLIALVGIFITVLMKKMNVAVIIAIITLIVETAGMTMRVLISGRAPITNMYETVMFSGYGALLIALIILYFKRDKIFLLAGLGYNILCLFMMMFANNMLSSSISPLVPVLRDNFWLSTHVTTIILSYAAIALSWMVANIILIKLRFRKITKSDYRYGEQLIYTCIKVGIILLAAGIILGGIWADYSWGRFWGWDPKETWSLIVLLFYMAILHGKKTSWFTTHRFIILSAAGFMTVMMAWFGVNYILASGLHSYGFSEGGAIFLGTFFLVQTVILFICGVQKDFKDA